MKKLLCFFTVLSLLLSLKPISVQASNENIELAHQVSTLEEVGSPRAATAGITSIIGYVASIERGEYSTDLRTVQSGYINGRYTNTLNTIFSDNLSELYDKLNCDGFLLSVTVLQSGSTNYKAYSNNVLIGSGKCVNGAITFDIPIENKTPGTWKIIFTNAIGHPQATVSGQVLKL